ncbi:hypothetical protein V7146_16015 [Gottfriedia acidiceleris]|uniref:hypothetical protein n=1 Tax=Gottfriedia acidiceleris TaxID=371036 RepID=UPI002FFEDF7A
MKTNFDFIMLKRINIRVLKTIEKHGIKININVRSINNGNSVSGFTPLYVFDIPKTPTTKLTKLNKYEDNPAVLFNLKNLFINLAAMNLKKWQIGNGRNHVLTILICIYNLYDHMFCIVFLSQNFYPLFVFFKSIYDR